MPAQKGFTLIEILVVLTIIGGLTALALPSIFANMEQTKAQAAENNLMAISAAEQKYYEDYGVYCTTTTNATSMTTLHCGDTAPDLSANLILHLSTSDPFYGSYRCIVAGSAYSCTTTDGTDTLVLAANPAGPGFNVTCTVGGNNCP